MEESNEISLADMLDGPIRMQLEQDPTKICMIPRDCYDRILAAYEKIENFEMCTVLHNLIGKVSKQTAIEIIAEYQAGNSLLIFRLAQILELVSKSREKE